jgi:hypothetical protein
LKCLQAEREPILSRQGATTLKSHAAAFDKAKAGQGGAQLSGDMWIVKPGGRNRGIGIEVSYGCWWKPGLLGSQGCWEAFCATGVGSASAGFG